MARKKLKQCLYCGTPFAPPRTKFCSRPCSLRYRKGTKKPRGPNTGRSTDKEYRRDAQRRRRGWTEDQIKAGVQVTKDKYAPARKLGFRSMFEARIAEKAAKEGRELAYESVKVKYLQEGIYLPDFKLENGILIECKGKFDWKDRKKMLSVRECNPELDIRFVFQRASNRLTKSKNSMTYGEWCTKHNFKWSEGTIPDEWHDE